MSDELRPEAGIPEADESEKIKPENDGPAAGGEPAGIEAPEDSVQAVDDANEESLAEEGGEDEAETSAKPRPPAKLERLQKILAQAGVASRRRAEELIEQGRVQVNGKIVTELGTKADAGRDHIRVDGKLLQGAERLRYFVLNKPKGFVTTVKDPEGRPTVMQFFEKMRERLYPVGRLDYMSEGLLLVTNDGELANKLTKAASGVEKTYLVKVSGQPTEAELDILRGGVAIERGKPGSAQVRTSPARIRQVRQGDNPWYEVVLIEGRNRELRKMFEEVGHFVEKIRRVGYGPLVLDQEPGNLRELQPEELDELRKAAEGRLRTPKSKEIRRRNAMDAQLPTLAPKPSGRPRAATPAAERPAASGPGEFRPKRTFGGDRPSRPARPAGEGYRPAAGRAGTGPNKFGPAKFGPGTSGQTRPAWKKDDGPGRPAWKKDDRTARPAPRFAAGPAGESQPGADRGGMGSAVRGRKDTGRAFGAKAAWNKPGASDRPAYKRPEAPRREAPPEAADFVQPRPPRLQIDAIEPDRPGTERAPFVRQGAGRTGQGRPGPVRAGAGRSRSDRTGSVRAGGGRPVSNRPASPRPGSGAESIDRPRFERPRFDRPATNRPGGGPGRTGAGASGYSRPPRGESGLARPFTTSTGKPRAGGARPSSKPSKPGGRSYGAGPGAGSRPAAGGGSAPRPAGKTAWKPKPSFGGGGKPASGSRPKPAFGSKPGGFSKSGYKGKPGSAGGKRTGPRPGGKKRG